MARGIRKKDFYYEIDQVDNDGTATVVSHMLVSLDQYNVATEDDNGDDILIKKSETDPNVLTHIKAHINLNKNINKFGIHPRHAVLEWTGTAAEAACYGSVPKRFVELPILTLEQFGELVPWDFEREDQTEEQENAEMTVNHSFDGSAKLKYKIKKLVPQELI
jgi:hypothetical protein